MTYEEIVEYVRKSIKKTAVKEIKGHLALEVNIYGEGEGAFYIEADNGQASVEPYEYYDRDAKVKITFEELAKIIKGEKTPVQSFEEESLVIEGNINAAQEILKIFKAPVKKTATKKAPAKKTPASKTEEKKAAAEKTVKVEKKIVEQTKKKDSKIAKDIKK